MTTGIKLITEHRSKHPDKGYDTAHDNEHSQCELLHAAKAYMICAEYQAKGHPSGPTLGSFAWPWEPETFKPSFDPIKNLAKAGALIAAEIDRLDRLDPIP